MLPKFDRDGFGSHARCHRDYGRTNYARLLADRFDRTVSGHMRLFFGVRSFAC